MKTWIRSFYATVNLQQRLSLRHLICLFIWSLGRMSSQKQEEVEHQLCALQTRITLQTQPSLSTLIWELPGIEKIMFMVE